MLSLSQLGTGLTQYIPASLSNCTVKAIVLIRFLRSRSKHSSPLASLADPFLNRARPSPGFKHSPSCLEYRLILPPLNIICSIWAFYIPLFGTLVNLGLLYWKRHSHPLNFVLLSTFTLMEAFTLGVVVAFFDNVIVMQALWVLA